MTGTFKYIKPVPVDAGYNYTIEMTGTERVRLIVALRLAKGGILISAATETDKNGICQVANDLLKILGVAP